MTSIRVHDDFVPMQPAPTAVEVRPFVAKAWKGRGGGKGPMPAKSRILQEGALAWVELSQGLWAVIDADDIGLIEHACWSAHRIGATHYAVSRISFRGLPKRQMMMHRVILDDPEGLVVDHLNMHGLDNRRCNLRACTNAQNMQNSGRNSRNTTGFKGVHFNTADKKFVAMIRVGGRKRYLGRFDEAETAFAVYVEAARKIHGEFARFE